MEIIVAQLPGMTSPSLTPAGLQIIFSCGHHGPGSGSQWSIMSSWVYKLAYLAPFPITQQHSQPFALSSKCITMASSTCSACRLCLLWLSMVGNAYIAPCPRAMQIYPIYRLFICGRSSRMSMGTVQWTVVYLIPYCWGSLCHLYRRIEGKW